MMFIGDSVTFSKQVEANSEQLLVKLWNDISFRNIYFIQLYKKTYIQTF